jgi:ribose transport system substrate-binding protein
MAHRKYGLFRAAALFAACALLVSGCSRNSISAQEKPLVIDVIVKKYNADFWKVVQMGADAAGKEFGAKINFQGPADEQDIDGQIRMVDDAIGAKADAIVLAASDYTKLVPVTEKAVEAKIPVIIIDSDVKTDKTKSFIGTNNEDAGRKLGETLVSKVGPICRIAIMGFVQGAATNDQREEGLLAVIGKQPGIHVLATKYCNSDENIAKALTLELVQQYPDLDAIVCLNAQCTVGAARAVNELKADGKVRIIGFDSTPEEISFMEMGTIQSLIVQNPYSMGYDGVKYAVDAIHGKSVPMNVNTGATVVDKENMYSPENQKLLFPFTS